MAALSDVNGHIDPAVDSNTPTTNGGDATTLKDQAAGIAASVKNTAASALNSAQNTQFAQDLANGPAAQTVKKEAAATSNEFADLANSRKMPEHTAANDTPLTHYHSFFFNLLSWKNPRATGISFASVLAFIFACRYLPIGRLALRGTWTLLGVITIAEAAAKYTIGSSVASQVRPRRYYKIPKESLESALDDVEQLINFFVIEIQRIVFAENIPNTAVAFAATFLSYYLVKLLPTWGFALFAACVTFLVPLVYTQNKELIDAQYEHVSNIAAEQTRQIRDLTAEHTSKAAETIKGYTGEYTSVASEYIGKSRQKIPILSNGDSKTDAKSADFPEAPKTDLSTAAADTTPAQTAPVEEPVAEPVAVPAS